MAPLVGAAVVVALHAEAALARAAAPADPTACFTPEVYPAKTVCLGLYEYKYPTLNLTGCALRCLADVDCEQ